MVKVPGDVGITKDTQKNFPLECVSISENNKPMSRDSNDEAAHGKYVNSAHPIKICVNIEKATPP